MPKDLIHPLLSHQSKEELYKCIPITFFKTRIYFCSRCLGYWFALLPSFVYHIVARPLFFDYFSLAILFVLPIFTFIDWGLTKLKIIGSHNGIRFVFATLLGFSLAHAFYLFWIDHLRIYVGISAIFYLLFFLVIIFFSKRKFYSSFI